MYEEPRPMREIHSIQEKIYEEYKNLSNEEKLARMHKEAEEAGKRFGLRLRKASHAS